MRTNSLARVAGARPNLQFERKPRERVTSTPRRKRLFAESKKNTVPESQNVYGRLGGRDAARRKREISRRQHARAKVSPAAFTILSGTKVTPCRTIRKTSSSSLSRASEQYILRVYLVAEISPICKAVIANPIPPGTRIKYERGIRLNSTNQII